MQQATAVKVSTVGTPRTFLDELNAIMAQGSFTDAAEPATNDEPVIGEMNDYERVLQTFCNHCELGQRELLQANAGVLQGEHISKEKNDRQIITRQVNSLTEHYEAAKQLLWASIKDRLHDTIRNAADSTGFGIRQGFKIVLLFEEKDCLEDLFESLLSGRGFGGSF